MCLQKVMNYPYTILMLQSTLKQRESFKGNLQAASFAEVQAPHCDTGRSVVG